jgi:nucleotide-binding universal stress UspA family protein
MRTSERNEEQCQTSRLVLDNILFATDFSPASDVGLGYALALARRYQGKVYMVPAVSMDFVEAIGDDVRRRALHQSRVRALNWIAQLQVSGGLDGVRHELSTTDRTEESLSRALKNQAFELAINGVACREGQKVLLEPTVEEAIRKSECPVLTIGSKSRGVADREVKNILYATDFSAESLEASRYALSLAQEFQARLTLLHVVEGLEPRLLDERARIARPYRLWLGKLVPDEASLWCELDFAVEFGRPAERILQVARENHADLVVLGARGLDQLTSPGLNVRKVICNAWCPVLTVSGVSWPPRSRNVSGERQQRLLTAKR